MDQDETWHAGRPRPRRLCVRWGPSCPLLKKGRSPQFLAHIYCGQTAVCIRMPLGTEVGLSLGNIVLWGPRSRSPKGAQPPIFGQCPLWPNGGWTKMPLGMEVGLGPSDFVCSMGTKLPSEKKTHPQFLANVYCGHGRPSQLLLSSCEK